MNQREEALPPSREERTRVALLILGIAMLLHQEFFPEQRALLLQLIGAGFCGPVAAVSVATVIRAFRGGPGE